ncbi:MAG: transporter, partial [Planctomycetes bacterium]|nr:transporter [Planctomycetota bacterium]
MLLAALLLSSCGGAPARPTLPANPPAWATTTASSAVSDGWIADFADPELPPLVAEAWSANHDLAAASARVEAARAEARIAGAESWP